MKHLITIAQYSALENVSGAAIRMRLKRGTLKFKRIDGKIYIFVNSDKTIKKPRKKN